MAARESLVNLFQLSSLVDRLLPRARAGIRVPVRRPDDHLVFDLLFDNLRIERNQANAADLVRQDTHRRGILIVFWPEVPGDPKLNPDLNFRFEVAATDVSGQRVSFSLPMLFVSEVVNAQLSVNLRYAYSEAAEERRTAQIGGDGISYDQSDGADPDDSRLSTVQLRRRCRSCSDATIPSP